MVYYSNQLPVQSFFDFRNVYILYTFVLLPLKLLQSDLMKCVMVTDLTAGNIDQTL